MNGDEEAQMKGLVEKQPGAHRLGRVVGHVIGYGIPLAFVFLILVAPAHLVWQAAEFLWRIS